MEPFSLTRHPVLRYLAAVRAARDFGLDSTELDALAPRVPLSAQRVEEFAEAATAALLARG
jgi:hypothetical protein